MGALQMKEHFRLEQLQQEFDFVSDDVIENSRRFQLIQLREQVNICQHSLLQHDSNQQKLAENCSCTNFFSNRKRAMAGLEVVPPRSGLCFALATAEAVQSSVD